MISELTFVVSWQYLAKAFARDQPKAESRRGNYFEDF
jgi:hypothetical protein